MWRKKQCVAQPLVQSIHYLNENNVLVDVSSSEELKILPPTDVYTLDALLAAKIPLDEVRLSLSSPEQDSAAVNEVTAFMSEIEKSDNQTKSE